MDFYSKYLKRNEALKLIILSLFVFYLYVFYLSTLDPVNALRLKCYDVLYNKRYSHVEKERPNHRIPIVIAAVDNESLRILKERWPWRRSLFAQFINNVRTMSPSVIAFDLSFSVPSANFEDDLLFQMAIRKAGNVILGSYFNSAGDLVEPIKMLRNPAKHHAFLNTPRDADNVNRKKELRKFSHDMTPYYSFGLITAAEHQDIPVYAFYEQVIERYKKKQPWIFKKPTDEAWVSYDYKASDFKIIPFWKFIKHQVLPEEIVNKILIIGPTGEIFHDIYSTPLGIMPGVVLQANIIMDYLNQVYLKPLSYSLMHTIGLVLMFVFSLLFYRISRIWISLLALGIFLYAAYLISAMLFTNAIVVDLFLLFYVIIAAFLLVLIYRSIVLFIENQGLRIQTVKDGLTDLYTYRYMEKNLMQEFDRSEKDDIPLSFVIFDLDHFKKLNDVYGHEKGNDVLIAFSRILKSHTRDEDLVARYGGEEFCILLPGRDEEEASQVAERIRQSLEKTPFKFQRKKDQEAIEIHATVSAGICCSTHENVFTVLRFTGFSNIHPCHNFNSRRNRTL